VDLLDPLELQLAVPVLSDTVDVSTRDVKSELAACGSGLFGAESVDDDATGLAEVFSCFFAGDSKSTVSSTSSTSGEVFGSRIGGLGDFLEILDDVFSGSPGRAFLFMASSNFRLSATGSPGESGRGSCWRAAG
jgi:hypothetical protein